MKSPSGVPALTPPGLRGRCCACANSAGQMVCACPPGSQRGRRRAAGHSAACRRQPSAPAIAALPGLAWCSTSRQPSTVLRNTIGRDDPGHGGGARRRVAHLHALQQYGGWRSHPISRRRTRSGARGWRHCRRPAQTRPGWLPAPRGAARRGARRLLLSRRPRAYQAVEVGVL